MPSRARPQAKALALAGFAAALVGPPRWASAAGYYAGPVGTKAAGRGGAFVARADDLTAAIYNPAGLVHLRSPLGIQLENKASYSSFAFTRDPTRDGLASSSPLISFNPSENEARLRLAGPLLGVASNLGLRNWAFALVAYTPSGASKAQFPEGGGQRYLLVAKDIVVINSSLSAAWQALERLAFGVSAQVISVPSIKYQLVIDNAPGAGVDVYNPVSSVLDMLTTLRASDPFTLNLTAGLWAKPYEHFEFGLSAQLVPANIDARGTLQVEPVSPVALGILEQQDPPIPPGSAISLTRDGVAANDIRVELPLPLTFRAGVRFFEPSADGQELYDLELDATYETWSRVRAFRMDGNHMEARFAGITADAIPLDVISVQKHWQDTLTLAVGGDVRPIAWPVSIRGGAYYETGTAPEAYANVDFPTGPHLGLTAGLTVPLGPLAVNLAYEWRHMIPFRTVEAQGRVRQVKPNLGDNPRPEAAPPVVNAGSYRSSSHSVGFGVAWQL